MPAFLSCEMDPKGGGLVTGYAMLGAALAILAAATVTAKQRKIKKFEDFQIPSMVVALYMFLVGIPILLLVAAIAVYLHGSFPVIKAEFWRALGINSPLIVVANFLLVKAHRNKDEYSVVAPLVAIIPIGVAIGAMIKFQYLPNLASSIGIVITMLGLYFLGLSKGGKIEPRTMLLPFKLIISSGGARYMLGACFIWMITSVYDKQGVNGVVADHFTQSMIWCLFKGVASTIVLLIICIIFYRRELQPRVVADTRIIYLSLYYALEQIFHMTGVAVWNVVFVNVIKRISILFDVWIGIYRDKNKGGATTVFAALMVIAGIAIISFLGK